MSQICHSLYQQYYRIRLTVLLFLIYKIVMLKGTGVSCFIIVCLLWVTGMILEKVGLIRVVHARLLYSGFIQINV